MEADNSSVKIKYAMTRLPSFRIEAFWRQVLRVRTFSTFSKRIGLYETTVNRWADLPQLTDPTTIIAISKLKLSPAWVFHGKIPIMLRRDQWMGLAALGKLGIEPFTARILETAILDEMDPLLACITQAIEAGSLLEGVAMWDNGDHYWVRTKDVLALYASLRHKDTKDLPPWQYLWRRLEFLKQVRFVRKDSHISFSKADLPGAVERWRQSPYWIS